MRVRRYAERLAAQYETGCHETLGWYPGGICPMNRIGDEEHLLEAVFASSTVSLCDAKDEQDMRWRRMKRRTNEPDEERTSRGQG